ncbi:MAG: GNAT family N-acetyltransferase [Oscillospiraceae bacterium]|jgi:aminoglycoside 6'-N-acetyltransferase I
MNSNLKFVPMEQSMLDQCVDLFMDTFSREPWNERYDSREQVVALFERYRANNYFLGYAVVEEEKVIALSVGYQKPWIQGMEYAIEQFCVEVKHQGNGVGSQLLQHIERDIAKKGLNAIILNTERGFPAERFYRKNGFRELENFLFLAK